MLLDGRAPARASRSAAAPAAGCAASGGRARARISAFADAVTKHAVEGVVGGERGVHVGVACSACGEALVGRRAWRSRSASVRRGTASSAASACSAATTGNASRAARRSSGATRVNRCGAVSTSPSCSSRLSASRTGVRLRPEPRAQLLVAQPLPGRERPVDDRVAQRHIRPVTEQIALERAVFGRNWHVKYQYATS